MKIAEIARQHDRTYGAIRARLKKQGLINNSCKLYLKQYFFPCSMLILSYSKERAREPIG